MKVKRGAWHIARSQSGVFQGRDRGKENSMEQLETGGLSWNGRSQGKGERKDRREDKGEAKNNVFELGKIPSNATLFRTVLVNTHRPVKFTLAGTPCCSPSTFRASVSPLGSCQPGACVITGLVFRELPEQRP